MSQAEPLQSSHPDNDRSLAERVSLGVSSSILLVLIGLVGYLWVQEDKSPPILSITITEAPHKVEGQFYVPFELTNEGGQTAEAVKIVAELRVNNQVEETGEQEIDFLSRDEKEMGAFIFTKDPRQGDLRLRVTGYKLP